MLIENGRKIQICNYHHSQAIYRRHAKMDLLKPFDAKFSTYYIMHMRLMEMTRALTTTTTKDMGPVETIYLRCNYGVKGANCG